MTLRRRVTFALITPLAKLIIRGLWLTCRIEAIEGKQHMEEFIAAKKPVIICYWHRLQVFCSFYLFKLAKRGMLIGFLISPSVDGEVPARIVTDWGAQVVRASTTRSGAKALRDIYQLIKQGVSPITSSDGPTGPIFEFKPGAVMLAQFSRRPMLPMSFAADRAWRLNTWDKFLLPKPFARIRIVIGKPYHVPANLDEQQLQAVQKEMTEIMKSLYRQAGAPWQ